MAEIGDHVLVRLRRSEDGSGAVHCRGDKSLPLTECIVTRKGTFGLERLHQLVYADTGKPVGIPFYPEDFEEVYPSTD